MFCQLILDPIFKVSDAIMNFKKEETEKKKKKRKRRRQNQLKNWTSSGTVKIRIRRANHF